MSDGVCVRGGGGGWGGSGGGGRTRFRCDDDEMLHLRNMQSKNMTQDKAYKGEERERTPPKRKTEIYTTSWERMITSSF